MAEIVTIQVRGGDVRLALREPTRAEVLVLVPAIETALASKAFDDYDEIVRRASPWLQIAEPKVSASIELEVLIREGRTDPAVLRQLLEIVFDAVRQAAAKRLGDPSTPSVH